MEISNFRWKLGISLVHNFEVKILLKISLKNLRHVQLKIRIRDKFTLI